MERKASEPAIGLTAVFGPAVIWGLVFGLGGLVSSSDISPGQCQGFGDGCTAFSPQEALWVLGVYLGLLVVPVVTIVTTIALLSSRRTAIVLSLLGVFASGSLGFVVVVSVLGGRG